MQMPAVLRHNSLVLCVDKKFLTICHLPSEKMSLTNLQLLPRYLYFEHSYSFQQTRLFCWFLHKINKKKAMKL